MPRITDPIKRERNAQRLLGCSEAVALRINGGAPLRHRGSPAQRYLYQRQSAFKRGISWEINFPEWWGVWLASGKWDMRGVGIGSYCMARNGDVGPYSLENVSIQLSALNSRDGISKARGQSPLDSRVHGTKAGHGRGWTYVERARHRPYQVVVARKYIGCFASQEEAEAAYQAGVCAHRESVFHGSIELRSPVLVMATDGKAA